MSEPSRSREVDLRAELWAMRKVIGQEKLRCVAPYPFFGSSMRFQDEFSALQITDDGRFSYSTVSFENMQGVPQAADADSTISSSDGRRVTTYEGIFIMPKEEEVGNVPSEPPAFMQEDAPMKGDTEVAQIEGKSLVTHSFFVEEMTGRIRLECVYREINVFSITVAPFYQPTFATVMALASHKLQGYSRRRQLPYVGTGMVPCRSSMSPVMTAAKLNMATSSEKQQMKRWGPRLKFSRSVAAFGLQVPGNNKSGGGTVASVARAKHVRNLLPQLVASSSAPQLSTVKFEDTSNAPVDQWRDYYRERAKNTLGSVIHK